MCNHNIAKERGTDIVAALPMLAGAQTLGHDLGMALVALHQSIPPKTIKHPMSHLRCFYSHTLRLSANKSQWRTRLLRPGISKSRS